MSTVSVIIPAYNAGRTLGQTLGSVFSQTSPAQEVIVVDDGSDDTTAEVARSFPMTRLLPQENTGPGGALNAGAACAQGELLIFLDADDLLMRDAISSHRDVLADHPEVDAAVGHMEEFICESESAEAARRLQPRPLQPCWLAGGVALRSDAFRRVGPFDTRLRAGHWIDWMHRAKLAGLTFHVHDALVLKRRLHMASLSMRQEVSKGKGLILAARNAILRRRAAEADSETTKPVLDPSERTKT